jgi:hypothetical protein
VVLAAMSLRFCGLSASATAVLALATVLILSRPGHWNLYGGQLSFQMAIATYLALWFARTRVALSGVGLALATLKPTYGVPLAILMLIRGDRRAVAVGVMLATLVTGAATVRLASIDGVFPLIESIKGSYMQRETMTRKRPEESPLRLDVVAMSARLAGESPSLPQRAALMAGVLALAGFGLWRIRGDATVAARLLSMAIAGLAVLLCIYHQQYDVVVLTAPLIAVVFAARTGLLASFPKSRWLATIALAIPFVNYLSSYTAARALGWSNATIRAWSSLNGTALVVALLVFIVAAYAGTTSGARE